MFVIPKCCGNEQILIIIVKLNPLAERARLDYVSCSPFRVPVARLAAAQAAIRNK